MKKCSKCNIIKNKNEFYKKNKNGYYGWCKSCLLDFQKQRWKSRKADAVNLFGGKCCMCGYNKNLAALDFHHLDPTIKEYNWNRLCQFPWDKIVLELKKCILVCRNCHAELHNPDYTLENIQNNNGNNNLNKDRKIYIKSSGNCPICNSETYGTKYCSTKCAGMSYRKVKRPSKEALGLDIKNLGYCGTGRKYGVSDNTIRKWLNNTNS